MAGYPPAGMAWGGYAHPAVQQLPQRPQALPIEALGLGIGSRIEVRWDIVPDEGEDGDPYTKWWGARIIRQAPPQQGVPMGPCYVIAYDSDEGFEAEERTIRIMSQHDLVDLEDGDPLHWRREGERWEPPEEETYR
ncbi:hypothetical protein MNEG_6263 [Monoraphidium neglectum]|uniref:Uncharacterized protein n=1 Tax=Monoraphidium neglectum TaxID=145388 RepID=A0A0D2MMD4_9CHLO|nr:hypothetical protein MNEG_6263 [Monoraphidium neglectum]KIZ01697.1 hypothetical protein MNEG_6263 [Monoraphidium neglectum]|eukprot:XP_013900716.1 hypothetical protein MNEG_6263 [Monoraphidium neglectum]